MTKNNQDRVHAVNSDLRELCILLQAKQLPMGTFTLLAYKHKVSRERIRQLAFKLGIGIGKEKTNRCCDLCSNKAEGTGRFCLFHRNYHKRLVWGTIEENLPQYLGQEFVFSDLSKLTHSDSYSAALLRRWQFENRIKKIGKGKYRVTNKNNSFTVTGNNESRLRNEMGQMVQDQKTEGLGRGGGLFVTKPVETPDNNPPRRHTYSFLSKKR